MSDESAVAAIDVDKRADLALYSTEARPSSYPYGVTFDQEISGGNAGASSVSSVGGRPSMGGATALGGSAKGARALASSETYGGF